jgi:Xaa-Pro aminopeptidase
MFQDFTSSSDPTLGAERVAKLRARLKKLGVDAVIVPRFDEHMGEYVPPSAERLAWLTGFTGSAGWAIIGQDKAALFVDGRYTLQAPTQVPTSIFDVVQIPETAPAQWIIKALGTGARIGFDPWLHTRAGIALLEEAFAKADITLKALPRNPVDEIWGSQRPPAPLGPVAVQPLELAGVAAADKIKDLQRRLREAAEDAVILTLPDSIAWLFNIRGSDVKHNPTPLAFAMIPASGKAELFIEKAKLGPEVRAHLEAMRAETQALKEISFDTISGSGPNGAIVHYRVTEATNRRLQQGELFLVDSGAQFIDGTTDITRTVAIGAPTAEMRDRFTRVLMGHIAISELRFPPGTNGAHIDAFARHALWQAGFDYDHGTGHGVGSYLSVHEGPQSISKRGQVVIEAGMILSNEPGYYKTGAYGIRIENLLLVHDASPIAGGERPMMGFETLTLVPIDRRLVDPALLGPAGVAWLNAYHARVAAEIGPHLTGADRDWLDRATAPVAG